MIMNNFGQIITQKSYSCAICSKKVKKPSELIFHVLEHESEIIEMVPLTNIKVEIKDLSNIKVEIKDDINNEPFDMPDLTMNLYETPNDPSKMDKFQESEESRMI